MKKDTVEMMALDCQAGSGYQDLLISSCSTRDLCQRVLENLRSILKYENIDVVRREAQKTAEQE